MGVSALDPNTRERRLWNACDEARSVRQSILRYRFPDGKIQRKTQLRTPFKSFPAGDKRAFPSIRSFTLRLLFHSAGHGGSS